MSTCMPSCDNISYMLLNLVGEVGEFASKLAKDIRKGNVKIEKLNTAASMGWLVLRITTDDRFASKTYDLIKAAVEYRINES